MRFSDLSSVVLADFGLATFVHQEVYLYCRCGTPGFVAPEVININDMKTTYEAVCDIYSLGCVLVGVCVCGCRLHIWLIR